MDECKGFILCKNRIKYRTNVVISPENRKDVGCLACTLNCTHACVMYVQVYRTDELYILDWWSDVCTGLVYYMYWTGCAELDWCDVCTQLVCCMRGEGRDEALPLHLY